MLGIEALAHCGRPETYGFILAILIIGCVRAWSFVQPCDRSAVQHLAMHPRVTEFQSIMPIANIGSVLCHGILSYEQAARLRTPGTSVAMAEVQERRDQKQVPGGLKLHRYANLYFHARNPMMSKRRNEAQNLCVLRVSKGVLAIAGTVLTDCNAASEWVRFLAPAQWSELDFDDIFAADWRHPGNAPAYYRHKSRKCAEVLVPKAVPYQYLEGAYVVDESAAERLSEASFTLPISIDADLFFH